MIIDRYGYPEQAYFTFCYSPIRDESGIVCGMMDTVIETTGKVEAQRQSHLLNRELEHRIKNTLAVVSAIVTQTLQSTDADPTVREALVQRISALSRAQSVLTRSDLAEANIHDVIEESLAPFRTDNDRIQVNGPQLSSKQAFSLALSVNELATNALKYGALSNKTGQVRILWQAGRPGTEDAFHFTWVEAGGPSLVPSGRKGFGSRIIERVLPQDFSGQAALIHDPAGIRCELSTQMSHLGENHGAEA